MKARYYLSVDSLQGPYETLAEAEFFAKEILRQLEKNPAWRRNRQVKVVEEVRSVK